MHFQWHHMASLSGNAKVLELCFKLRCCFFSLAVESVQRVFWLRLQTAASQNLQTPPTSSVEESSFSPSHASFSQAQGGSVEHRATSVSRTWWWWWRWRWWRRWRPILPSNTWSESFSACRLTTCCRTNSLRARSTGCNKTQKNTREEKRKVALEISKEEAVQQSAVGGFNFPCRESVEEQLHLSASSVSGPPSPSEDLRNPLLFFYLSWM